MTATHENNHVSDRLAACQICGLVQQLPADSKAAAAKCARCDTVIHRHIPNSRARTMAFTLAALVLYVPANLYPVMTMDTMGRHSENTVWAGVVSLCQEGMWFVGGVVFVASILVPVLKLLGLFFLSLMAAAAGRAQAHGSSKSSAASARGRCWMFFCWPWRWL